MSTVETIGRAVIGLAAILLVLWLIARAIGRRQRKAGHVVEVVARTQVSKHASVAVLRIGGRDVVVGVTEGGVSLLGDVDGLRDRAADSTPASPAPVRPLRAVGTDDAAALAVRPHDERPSGPLAGSALSPATWKQSVDALRDLTVRSRAR